MIRVLAIVAAIALAVGPVAAETIEIGGVARTFLTQFPEAKPAPLVIALHGNTQTGAECQGTRPPGR